MTAVHQFHPTLALADAMSNHVFALRDRLRAWGYESDAFAVDVKPGVESEALSYRRLFRSVKPEDTLILHFSMGNEVFDQLIKIPARRVLVYHNITPPEFFSGINDHAAAFARLGLRQLEQIAPAIDLAIGVSAFNRQDLDDMGFRKTAHVPILIDWKLYDTAPDPAVLARWSVFGRKLLFVGRISPNKRHDDLLRMFAYYRAVIDPEAQRVLSPGAPLVFITPNVATLTVGAHSFWLDPSHVRPIPPELFRFYLEVEGFVDVDVRTFEPSEKRLSDKVSDPTVRENVKLLNETLFGDRDYAVIGHAPA